MRIVIVGLGALGTVFATALKAAGNWVIGITKDYYIDKFRAKQFKIKGIFGDKQAIIDNVVSNSELTDDLNPDLIIISVKAYDTETAIKQIIPIVKDNTVVLLAQNGYGNYEIASSMLQKDKIILSRVIFGARIIEPAFAEVTVFADDIVIGQPENLIPREKLEEIADVLNKAGLPTRVSDNVYAILWDKILYNSALNPLGAIIGCTYGELASNKATRNIMNKIIEEIFHVTKAHEINLNWQSKDEYLKHFYEKLVPPTASHFPSMYYDVRQGKRTEIDALNGAIVKLAKKMNIQVPVNETITNIIKGIEYIISKKGS